MKKKILSVFLSILFLCACMFALASCGENEPAHTHNYSTLKFDNESHWFECECEEKNNIVSHNIKNGECACGYVVPHSHEYSMLKNDATEHWYECTCGDKSSTESHKGGIATCTELAVCSICNESYGELEEHSHVTLKNNETEHWYECVCGDKTSIETHIPGEEATETTDQKCTVCDCVITPTFDHIHTLHLTKVDANAQSCTEEGNIEYYTCDCRKWFTDNTATTEILDKASVVIEKDAHIHTILKHSETEHWYECVCGDKSGIESHKGGTATCEDKPICILCNAEYSSANGHTVVIDKAVTPSCTETGLTEGKHCSVCYDVLVAPIEIPANGHSFREWFVTKEPTETVKGEKRRDCVNCNHFETDIVAELAHDHSRWEQTTLSAVAPTCTTTGLTEGKKCSECGETLVAQEIVPANGHDHNAVLTVPTCTAKGYTTYTCACGHSYVADYTEALGHTAGAEADCENDQTCIACSAVLANKTGHSYKAIATSPTCTKNGYTTHTCDRCGDNYVDSIVSATGHKYDAWYTTKEPTESEAGEERHDCKNCDAYEINVLSALSHDCSRWPVTIISAKALTLAH